MKPDPADSAPKKPPLLQRMLTTLGAATLTASATKFLDNFLNCWDSSGDSDNELFNRKLVHMEAIDSDVANVRVLVVGTLQRLAAILRTCT